MKRTKCDDNSMPNLKIVFKYFSITNLTNHLQKLTNKEDQEAAMESFKWEAEAWENDPIGGPLRLYKQAQEELQREIGFEFEQSKRTSSSETTLRRSCQACHFLFATCDDSCVLAPYFPHNTVPNFEIVNNYFGYLHLLNHLQKLSRKEDKAVAIESFKWETEAWEKDPIRGPFGFYKHIEDERLKLWLGLQPTKSRRLY